MNAKWEVIQARMGEFNGNVANLWAIANSDQRIFLITMASLSLLFFLTAILVARWRIVNRYEIRKVKHFVAMRSVLLDEPEGISP